MQFFQVHMSTNESFHTLVFPLSIATVIKTDQSYLCCCYVLRFLLIYFCKKETVKT